MLGKKPKIKFRRIKPNSYLNKNKALTLDKNKPSCFFCFKQNVEFQNIFWDFKGYRACSHCSNGWNESEKGKNNMIFLIEQYHDALNKLKGNS